MKSKLALLASVLGLLAAAPGWAGTISFNFSDCASIVSPHTGCPGDLGTRQATFTDTTDTYAVTAYASPFSGPLTPNLFVKDDGGSENGLGLAGTYNDEVNYTQQLNQYVFLDMTDLIQSGYDVGTVTLGSLQPGESGRVCDFGFSGSGLTHCHTVFESGSTGYGSVVMTWGGNDPFLVFLPNQGQGNFLISSVTAPEPGSLALLGVGLAGLGLAMRRRRRSLAIK